MPAAIVSVDALVLVVFIVLSLTRAFGLCTLRVWQSGLNDACLIA